MPAAIDELDPANVAMLADHGITVSPLQPFGGRVTGMDLRQSKPADDVLKALQDEMARRGFLVFEGQGVLTGDEQVHASTFWGGRQLHSTHGVHPESPNRHIFRLSNDPDVGIVGVGPQWHNDGSFQEDVFSHVGYHIVRVPEHGGNTEFAHQGAAFDALSPDKQAYWSRLVSINATSGVLHPVVHAHPISNRKSVYLHLGMTGGIIHVDEAGAPRLLEHNQLLEVFNDYNDLLNAGHASPGGQYSMSYPYQEGDCIFIDNLAIAHRASPEAHMEVAKQGLRILHRTTIKAMQPFLPPFDLPAVLNGGLLCRANRSDKGVFVAGGIGFRWDESIRMQN